MEFQEVHKRNLKSFKVCCALDFLPGYDFESLSLNLEWIGGKKSTDSRMAYLQSVLRPVGIGLAAVSGSFQNWLHGLISATDRHQDKFSAAVNWCTFIGLKNSVDLHQLMMIPLCL